MKINDFLNDNFIILKTMYDNQVTVLNETQIPLSQIQIADALGYSKNKVYSVFKKLQQEGYIEAIGKGKYRLSDTSIVIIETMEKLDKKIGRRKIMSVFNEDTRVKYQLRFNF